MSTEVPDDGVDLTELVAGIARYRWLVLAVWVTVVAAAMTYYFFATPIYRTEALLAPNQQDAAPSLPGALSGLTNLIDVGLGSSNGQNVAIATLQSRSFVREFIDEMNLMPVLFEDEWDEQQQSWISEDPDGQPDVREGVQLFLEEVLSVVEDRVSGLVYVRVSWSDPDVATDWAARLIALVNERLRATDLAKSQARLAFLQEQLTKESYVEIRQALASLIEGEIQKSMLARVDTEYAFTVVDPPMPPHKRFSPKLKILLLLSVAGGLAIGVTLAALLALVRGTESPRS